MKDARVSCFPCARERIKRSGPPPPSITMTSERACAPARSVKSVPNFFRSSHLTKFKLSIYELIYRNLKYDKKINNNEHFCILFYFNWIIFVYVYAVSVKKRIFMVLCRESTGFNSF